MAQAMHLTSIPFDTLQYAKRLQEVGFTEKQAEVQVEMIKEQAITINDLINNHLATKADIKLLEERIASSEERINERMISLEERLANRITTMSYKIIISLGGLITAGVTILAYLK